MVLGRVKTEKAFDEVKSYQIKNSTIEKYKQVPESISEDFSVPRNLIPYSLWQQRWKAHIRQRRRKVWRHVHVF